jgi:integrase/recombinase XerD
VRYVASAEPVYSAERAISPADGAVAFVVVDEDYSIHAEASAYLAWLRSQDRSPNTERVYAGRVASFLTYCAAERIDWRSLSREDLARFLRSLVTKPMPGRLSQGEPRFRSNNTANAILTSACEFLRFASTRGWVSAELVERLSYPKYLRHKPSGFDWGEDPEYRVVRARSVKLSGIQAAPQWLTDDQVAAVRAAVIRPRDRLLIGLLLESGVRIGEALGLRRADMHLLSSSAPLGCSQRGPHFHVRRRLNANGMLAKSRYPRLIPVTGELVQTYAEYQHERSSVRATDASDFVFVNLYKPPLGEPLKYQNVKKMFDRASAAVGFSVRPHMLRHTAATRWVGAGTPCDVVQALLGHVSSGSMDVYMHPTEGAKREAVERVGRAVEER